MSREDQAVGQLAGIANREACPQGTAAEGMVGCGRLGVAIGDLGSEAATLSVDDAEVLVGVHDVD
eukprot:3070671-Lingulodinium_polyedra.AAC.1